MKTKEEIKARIDEKLGTIRAIAKDLKAAESMGLLETANYFSSAIAMDVGYVAALSWIIKEEEEQKS
jgi:hypothetical protein